MYGLCRTGKSNIGDGSREDILLGDLGSAVAVLLFLLEWSFVVVVSSLPALSSILRRDSLEMSRLLVVFSMRSSKVRSARVILTSGQEQAA